MGLAEIFPEGDYRFRMGFERGEPGEFFRATHQHDAIIEARKRWLEPAPHRYAALLPAGEPLLEETIDFARTCGTTPIGLQTSEGTAETALARCLALGRAWEPDYLLLNLASDGSVVLVAGCVCFPSSWSLEEKIGRPIETIHGVVPGLNSSIGTQIHAFLAKLKPGTASLRTNWGLSRSAELNQHPTRNLPKLDNRISPEEVWLRVEHQALVALPQTNGVLFGIRISMHPFNELRQDPVVFSRLTRALQTMPDDVASYKGLASARNRLLDLLNG